MICESCNQTILYRMGNVCPKCGGDVKVYPMTKRKTESEADKLWRKNNPRTEYFRDVKRKKNKVVIAPHVIEHEGKYKRLLDPKHRWDEFRYAKLYRSLGSATCAVKSMGYGNVMLRLETEEATVENWKTVPGR